MTDGGPAFPIIHSGIVQREGMTLRDWFAGMALQGLCRACTDGWQSFAEEAMSKRCYEQADSMLKERGK